MLIWTNITICIFQCFSNVSGGTSDNVTVYIWLPHGSQVGHASMELPDGTYISWWPSNKSKKSKSGVTAIATTAVLHDSLQEDIAAEGTDPEEFLIPGLDVACIKRWWDENKHGTYM